MALTVYITSISGNNAVRKKQQAILDALDVRNIKYSVVDVSSPENEEERTFMREKARPTAGHDCALPPQVFCDGEYVGDYEHFAEALEDNTVEVFFKQAAPVRKSPTPVEDNSCASAETDDGAEVEHDDKGCSEDSEVINEVNAEVESDEMPDSSAEDVASTSADLTSAEKSNEIDQNALESDSEEDEQEMVEKEEVQPSGDVEDGDEKVSSVTSEEATQKTEEESSSVDEETVVHGQDVKSEPSDENLSLDDPKSADDPEEEMDGEKDLEPEAAKEDIVEEEKETAKDSDADVVDDSNLEDVEKEASPGKDSESENVN